MFLTEGLTAFGILALLPLPLFAGLLVLPLIGVALNGTSSVLYGTVPELVAPERRSPEYLQKFVESEIVKWAAPIKAAGVVGE